MKRDIATLILFLLTQSPAMAETTQGTIECGVVSVAECNEDACKTDGEIIQTTKIILEDGSILYVYE